MKILIQKIADNEYKCSFTLNGHEYASITKIADLEESLKIGKVTAWKEFMLSKGIDIQDTDFFMEMKKANAEWTAQRYLDERQKFESEIEYIYL